MFKVIRIRIHGYSSVVYEVVREIFSTVGGRVILDAVDNVKMEEAVDIDCIFIGGFITRLVTVAKFMWKLAKLRNKKINVEILWWV